MLKKLVMCLAVVLMVSSIANADFWYPWGLGLLGYWNFEGNANDVSGYGNPANATLFGGATLTTEAGRNCLSAVNGGAIVVGNGINGNEKWDDIRGWDSPVIQAGTNPPRLRGSGITLSVWVKPNNVDEQWKFLLGMSTGWGARIFSMNSGALADCQDSDDGWNPVQAWQGSDWSGGIPNGPSLAWHNIIYAYDYKVQENRMYIDGVLRATANKGPALTGWWAASTDQFGIGTDNGTNSYNGFIDDVIIYSGAADNEDAYEIYISTPEPATMTMLGLGVLALIRRK
jgi:hypothetical protein